MAWTHASATKAKHLRETDGIPRSCSQQHLPNPALAAFLFCPLFTTGRLAIRPPADAGRCGTGARVSTAGNNRIIPSLATGARSDINPMLEETEPGRQGDRTGWRQVISPESVCQGCKNSSVYFLTKPTRTDGPPEHTCSQWRRGCRCFRGSTRVCQSKRRLINVCSPLLCVSTAVWTNL